MTNPDDDLPGKKLELALEESNLTEHEARHAAAAAALETASETLPLIPPPGDAVGRVLYVQALSAYAGAMMLAAQTGLMLETSRASLQHRRAHIDHLEAEQAKAGEVQDRLGGIMQEMQEKLREQGIRFEPGMLGGAIIRFEGDVDD